MPSTASRRRSRLAVLAVALGLLVAGVAWFMYRDQVRAVPIVSVSTPDERVLAVTFLEGSTPGCSEALDVNVEETSEVVNLSARVRTEGAGLSGKACILEGSYVTIKVTLDEPLGDRQVIDLGAEDRSRRAISVTRSP